MMLQGRGIFMELIIIDESRLKIMLTKTDMHHYDLPADSASMAGASARRAFRHIFEDARERIGFDTTGERLFVQLYASRGGGCEIFVTKLGAEEDVPREADLDGLYAAEGWPTEEDEGYTSGEKTLLQRLQKEEHMGEPHSVKRPPRAVSEDSVRQAAAYRVADTEGMLALCRRLSGDGYAGESAAYIDEEEAWYLFLTPTAGEVPPYLSEYGARVEDAESLSLRLAERGRGICARGAVEVLGGI